MIFFCIYNFFQYGVYQFAFFYSTPHFHPMPSFADCPQHPVADHDRPALPQALLSPSPSLPPSCHPGVTGVCVPRVLCSPKKGSWRIYWGGCMTQPPPNISASLLSFVEEHPTTTKRENSESFPTTFGPTIAKKKRHAFLFHKFLLGFCL